MSANSKFMVPYSQNQHPIFIALLAALALKIVLFAWFGPIMAPDTAGYTLYAERILAERNWLCCVDIASGLAPPEIARAPGYPLLIASFQTIFADYWPTGLVFAQMLLSLYASITVGRMLLALGLSGWPLAGLVFAQATTLPLIYDQMVLTDSLFASLLTLGVAALVSAGVRQSLSLPQALRIGFLFVAAYLLREVASFVMLLLLPLAVAAIWHTFRAAKGRAIASVLCVCLPVFAANQAMQVWNGARTGGQAFVSTNYRTALLLPLVEAYRYDRTLFAGDSIFDQTMRASVKNYHFSEVLGANAKLLEHKEVNAVSLSRLVKARYFAAWVAHPVAMTWAAMQRLRFNIALLFARPIGSADELLALARPEFRNAWTLSHLRRAVFRHGEISRVPLLVLESAVRIISIVLFVAFLTAPIALWRNIDRNDITGPPDARRLCLAALWCYVIAFYALHLIVHMEPRYLTPIMPFAIALAGWHLRAAYLFLRLRQIA